MSSTTAEVVSHARRWSLAARLTRHYVVSTGVILAAGAVLLLWTLERALDARDQAHVLSKLQVLQLLLREKYDQPEVIESEVEHEAAEAHAITYYLRILSPDGNTLLETTGMKDLLPPGRFPLPAPAGSSDRSNGGVRLATTPGFLLGTAQVETGGGLKQLRIVQVALALTAHQELYAEYRRTLLVGLVIGIVMAGVVGNWIARRGMLPLAQITAATQKISTSRLHERVSDARWPDEMTGLAHSIDQMLDRLEESFRRLSDFSVDMAHALRNPISNLRGEAEVALRQTRTPVEYQQVLGSSLEECERLSRMIDGLLFIARADDARVALERTTLSARREIEAVREFYEAMAEDAKVTVTCEGDAVIDGDPMLVRRAISNLLGNAIKHSVAGGRIRLSARTTEGKAEIVVDDNGVGIPQEHLPRVFDRFFQVDKSRDLTAKGSGLGLAIVRSIMTLHGGEVTITSAPEKGTTVTLRFPSFQPAQGGREGGRGQSADR